MLSEEGYRQLTENHLLNFVDPQTGAQTNKIESTWAAAKWTIVKPGRRRKNHFAENLAKYMFIKKCILKNLDKTVEFFKGAGALY